MRTRNAEGDLLFIVGLRNGGALSAGIRLSAPIADFSEPLTLEAAGSGYITFLPQDDYALFGPAADIYFLEADKTGRLITQLKTASSVILAFANADRSAGQSSERRFPLGGFATVLDAVTRELSLNAAALQFARPVGLDPAQMPTAAHHASIGPIASGPAPKGVPQIVFDMHLRVSDCEMLIEGALGSIRPQVARMSETAIVYAIPCIANRAGSTWRLYEMETGEIGGVRPLTLARYSPKFGWVGMDEPANVALNESARSLTARREGQDTDGCGYAGTWVYDQFDFRMERFSAAARCGALRQVWPTN
ncbi:MAG: hypothetical protein AAGD23_12740 [Pseudomonadota bacterium]